MSRVVFELGMNLVETLICVDFITRYLGSKYNDCRKTIAFIGMWIVSFVEITLINQITDFEGVGVFIPILVNFIYSLIFLKGGIFQKLWISALIEIITMVIAVGTNLIICQIIGYDPNDMITVFNSTRIISVIITKIILFYVSRMLLRHKYKNPLDTQAWVMLILIPVISVISLSALMLAALNHSEISNYIICGMAGILIANIITYYLFSALNKNYETKLKLNLLEQNNKNAVKNLENANAFVQQMKAARHDMKNQLLIISGYIDNAKYDEAKKYIESLTESYLPDMQDFISSDNEAFDAIANSKIAVCNQKGIYIEIKEMKNSLKDFDKTDTGVLFGNLLDNAIEAAEKTKSRRITVDVQTKGAYLSVLVTNSIETSVIGSNSELNTTKPDKELHGIGIKSIREIVKKYDGMIQFFEENGEFCCHIMLDTEKLRTKNNKNRV